MAVIDMVLAQSQAASRCPSFFLTATDLERNAEEEREKKWKEGRVEVIYGAVTCLSEPKEPPKKSEPINSLRLFASTTIANAPVALKNDCDQIENVIRRKL